MKLGLTLGYLDNIMTCIDASIQESFDNLEVSVPVSSDIFLLKLRTIMLGLSEDTLNIDLDLYLEFITLYIEGEISVYQKDSLTRKVLILSIRYISPLFIFIIIKSSFLIDRIETVIKYQSNSFLLLFNDGS